MVPFILGIVILVLERQTGRPADDDLIAWLVSIATGLTILAVVAITVSVARSNRSIALQAQRAFDLGKRI